MSNMQVTRKQSRSTADNWKINAIMEKQRLENKTNILYADPENCFDKLWVKDSLVQMENLGYSKDDMQMLYELNRNTAIIIETRVWKRETIININELVK